jgi:hypothetical protein
MAININSYSRDFINLAYYRTIETRKRIGGYL